MDNQQSILIGLAVAAGAGWLLFGNTNNVREINWQEFRTNYLERGEVDRLVVSNKSNVKVYLRSDPTTVSHKFCTLNYLRITYFNVTLFNRKFQISWVLRGNSLLKHHQD